MTASTEKCAGTEPVQVEASIRVLVTDPEALCDYARRRYAACWSDAEWSPENLAEAVLEALVRSNENPSPMDYGIEIVAAEAHAGRSPATAPRSPRPARTGGDTPV